MAHTAAAASLKFGGYFPPFPLHAKGKHLDTVEAVLKRRIDIVLWYQWWGTNWLLGKGTTQFQPRWATAAGDQRDVFIKWEPWTPGRNILQPRFAVPTIAAGAHDAYIRTWAQRIRDSGRTVYLCPMPEPNGFWNQWSTVVGKYEPEEYLAAWRRIHGIFAAEGANGNTRWVWAPNAGDAPDDNRMERYYPGSEYVDILGLSVYNWGTTHSWSRWRSFAEVVQPYYDRIGALGSQPIWIAEMACAPEGGDRVAWIRAMFAHLPELPRLEALIWFNAKKETDWRITQDRAVAQEFWNQDMAPA